jgi:hypothetical protein
VVETSGQRQSVNAISAVNPQGAFWYTVYTGKMNAGRFIIFLRDFMRRRRRPVFLVVDCHPTHRAKIVADYVQSLEGELNWLWPCGTTAGALSEDLAPMILVDDSGLEHLHGCHSPVGFGADHQIQIGLLRTRIEGWGSVAGGEEASEG